MATSASEKDKDALSEPGRAAENSESSIPARRATRLRRLEASITALERLVQREIKEGRVPSEKVLDPLAKLTFTWKLLADQVEKHEREQAKAAAKKTARPETPEEYIARKRREKAAAS